MRNNKGVLCWHYDFTLEGERKRGWAGPVDGMNRKDAEREVERIKAAWLLLGHEPTTPGNRRSMVKKVLDEYLDYLKEHKATTYVRQKHFFDHLAFFHGEAVTPDKILAYQKQRREAGVSGATINRELQAARSAFNRPGARKHLRGADNPFATFDSYEEVERTRYLSQDELGRLLKACVVTTPYGHSPHLLEIVLTAILTGWRKQSILRLHRTQVDLERGVLIKKATGTVKYKRDIITPISPFLLGRLRAKLEVSRHGYVFQNPTTGQPYGDIKKAWWNALSRAGIEDFRFHDLKHTFATYALLASKDLRGVMELCGHTRVEQTAKYAHVLDEQKTEIIALRDALFEPLLGTKMDKPEITNPQMVEMRIEFPGSAPASGAGGRRFESSHPDQKFPFYRKRLAPPPKQGVGLFISYSGHSPVRARDSLRELTIQRPSRPANLPGIEVAPLPWISVSLTTHLIR